MAAALEARIIAAAAASPGLEAFRGDVVGWLRELFDASSVMWGDWVGDVTARRAPRAVALGMSDEIGGRLYQHAASYGPELQTLTRALLGQRVVVDVSVPGFKPRSTQFHEEVREPAHAAETLYVMADVLPQNRSVLCINREGSGVTLGPAEVAAATRLRTTLAVAEAAVLAREISAAGNHGALSWSSLRPSERDVAELLRLGLTNRQIALALDLSANTVRNRLARMFRCLGVGSRAELVAVLGPPTR